MTGSRWVFALAALAAMALVVGATLHSEPHDAFAYWSAGNRPDPYAPVEWRYLYSPVFLQAGAILWWLPFDAFVAVLRSLEATALLVMAGPFTPLVALFPEAQREFSIGNVNLLIAACVVGGFRYPILWTFVLATKPTMAVGLGWFVLRGEWRKAALPVAVYGVLAAVSFLAAPRLWFDYASTLVAFDPVGSELYPWPVFLRLPIAAAMVFWAARTNRPWLAVLGAFVAVPRIYPVSLVMLVALLQPGNREAILLEVRRRQRPLVAHDDVLVGV